MTYAVHNAGLGFRREQASGFNAENRSQIGFMEVAPENWLEVGGHLGRMFRRFTEEYPFVCHGLSLNLGGSAPLDEVFLKRLKQFLSTHQIRLYSEHLSYCGDDGHLYDLMPIPFTGDAVKHVAARVRRTQDILEQRIAIENVSYYATPGQEMPETEFINAVLEEADCDLLLDVNNIYVNSVNHGYSAEDFLKSLPGERIAYGHVAGHYNEAEDFIIDTHGADVIDPVWRLLEKAYEYFGVFPTLLERDFNLPPLAELLNEVSTIEQIQQSATKPLAQAVQHGC